MKLRGRESSERTHDEQSREDRENDDKNSAKTERATPEQSMRCRRCPKANARLCARDGWARASPDPRFFTCTQTPDVLALIPEHENADGDASNKRPCCDSDAGRDRQTAESRLP